MTMICGMRTHIDTVVVLPSEFLLCSFNRRIFLRRTMEWSYLSMVAVHVKLCNVMALEMEFFHKPM